MAFRFDFGAQELDDLSNESSLDNVMETEPTALGSRPITRGPNLETANLNDSAKDEYVEIPLEQLVSPNDIFLTLHIELH